MVGGEKFLLHRARTDHLDFRGSVSVIGDSVEDADSPTMPYFDSRGVFRVYRRSPADGELKIWRDHPRVFASASPAASNDDLKITYRRPGG